MQKEKEKLTRREFGNQLIATFAGIYLYKYPLITTEETKKRSFWSFILNLHDPTSDQLVNIYRTCRQMNWRQTNPREINDFFEKKADILDPTFLFTLDDGRKTQYTALKKAAKKIFEEDKEDLHTVVFTLTQFGQTDKPIRDLPVSEMAYHGPPGDKTTYMAKGEIEELMDNHYINSHGVNHGSALTLSEGAYRGEMVTSYLNVQELYNEKGIFWQVPSYAHPFGNMVRGRNEAVDKAVGESGYKLGFAVKLTPYPYAYNPYPVIPDIQLLEITENDRFHIWRVELG